MIVSTSYITPFFSKWLGSKNLDLRCVSISDPSTVGALAKTRLESRIDKFTPHCVCRPLPTFTSTSLSTPRWPVRLKLLDLDSAPYGLYGLNIYTQYPSPLSTPSVSKIYIAPLFPTWHKIWI